MLPRSSWPGPGRVYRPLPSLIQTSRQHPPSRASPTVAFYKKYKAVHNQSLARRCPSAPSHSMAPAHSGFTSTLCSATGVTLSPAGVCVCYCMWSAVHAAVSAIPSQQVQLPWLQLACRVPTSSTAQMDADHQSCKTVKATRSRPATIWPELVARRAA
jgi:hypothetical protein